MKLLNRVRVPGSARTSQLLQTQDTTQNSVPTAVPWVLSHPDNGMSGSRRCLSYKHPWDIPNSTSYPEDSPAKTVWCMWETFRSESAPSYLWLRPPPQPANQSVVTAQHQEEQSALRNQLAPGIMKTKAGGPHPREATSLRKRISPENSREMGSESRR